MSPFKGQGANQAILDGVALARALYSSSLGFDTDAIGKSLGAALPRYALQHFSGSGYKKLMHVTVPEPPLSTRPSPPLGRHSLGILFCKHCKYLKRVCWHAARSKHEAPTMRWPFCIRKVRLSATLPLVVTLSITESLLEVNCPRAPALTVAFKSK